MDAMGFGMGCSCLQLTFQACNVDEARRLYDALIPVAPLMVLTLLISQAPHFANIDDLLARFDSSEPAVARVYRRCGLPMGRGVCQRR